MASQGLRDFPFGSYGQRSGRRSQVQVRPGERGGRPTLSELPRLILYGSPKLKRAQPSLAPKQFRTRAHSSSTASSFSEHTASMSGKGGNKHKTETQAGICHPRARQLRPRAKQTGCLRCQRAVRQSFISEAQASLMRLRRPALWQRKLPRCLASGCACLSSG